MDICDRPSKHAEVSPQWDKKKSVISVQEWCCVKVECFYSILIALEYNTCINLRVIDLSTTGCTQILQQLLKQTAGYWECFVTVFVRFPFFYQRNKLKNIFIVVKIFSHLAPY